MIPTARSNKPLLQQDLELDLSLLAAHEADAEIGFTADDRAENFVGAGVQQFDPDPRIAAAIVRDDTRQEIVGNRRYARDGHMAQAAGGNIANTKQRSIEVIEQLFSAWGEYASYSG